MGRQQRRYTEDEIAAALAVLESNNGNVSQTARDTGVPRKTIATWAASSGPTMPDGETRQEQKDSLADVFDRVAFKLASYVESWVDKFGEVPDGRMVTAAMTGAGIATDKARLLREQPTGRLEQVVTVEYRDETDTIAGRSAPNDARAAGRNPGQSGPIQRPGLWEAVREKHGKRAASG